MNRVYVKKEIAQKVIDKLRLEWGQKSHIEVFPAPSVFGGIRHSVVEIEFEHWVTTTLFAHGLYEDALLSETQDKAFVEGLLVGISL